LAWQASAVAGAASSPKYSSRVAMPAFPHLRGRLHADVPQVPGFVKVPGGGRAASTDSAPRSRSGGRWPWPRQRPAARRSRAGSCRPAAVADVERPSGLVFGIARPGRGGVRRGPPLGAHPAVVGDGLGGVGTVAARQRHDDALRRCSREHPFCGSRRRAVQLGRLAGDGQGTRGWTRSAGT
jgi:hypothetical protein